MSTYLRLPLEAPEYAAIVATRRWVMVSVTLATVLAFTLVLPLPLETVPIPQRVMLASMWTLAVVGTAFSRHVVGLWVLNAALLLVSLTIVVGGGAWTQIVPVLAIYELAFFVVVLAPRIIGLATVVVFSAQFVVLPIDQSLVLTLGTWDMTSGMVRALQLLLAGAFLSRAWFDVVRQAREGDARWQVSQRELDASVQIQERLRIWRDTAIRVHETMLNDIRYVLSGDVIDRARLRAQLGERPRVGRLEAIPGLRLSQIVHAAHESSGYLDDVDIDVPPILVDAEVAPYLKAALVEIMRNLERHGSGARARVRARTGEGWLTVTVASESLVPVPAGAGIGRALVLEESIAAVGGRVETSDSTMILRVPLPAGGLPASPDPRAIPGRIVVSGLMAAAAAGAFPYALALIQSGGVALTLAGILVLVLLAMGVAAAVRRKGVSTPALVVPAAIAAAVPLLMWTHRGACVEATTLAYVINISGYALLAIGAWSRSRYGWVLLVPWAVSSLVFVAASPPVSCTPVPPVTVLASVVVATVMSGVLLWTLPRSRRLSERTRALEEARVQEAARTEAALDMARTLDASIAAAWDVMADIAGEDHPDPERRITLRKIEARIRATIQVDSRTSGAMAEFAHDLVNSAVTRGRSVHVLSLRASQDRRPIPGALRETLEVFVSQSETEPTIQVFQFAGTDRLTITGAREAAQAAGLEDGSDFTVDGVQVEVQDSGDERGSRAVIVSRQAVQGED